MAYENLINGFLGESKNFIANSKFAKTILSHTGNLFVERISREINLIEYSLLEEIPDDILSTAIQTLKTINNYCYEFRTKKEISKIDLNEFELEIQNLYFFLDKFFNNVNRDFNENKLDDLILEINEQKKALDTISIRAEENEMKRNKVLDNELYKLRKELENVKKQNEQDKEEKMFLMEELSKNKSEREILLNELSANIKDSKEDAQKIVELKSKLEEEWDEFRNNYKEIFAKGEILRQSENFKDDSKTYYEISKKWRWFIVGALLLIIGTCIFFLFCCIDDLKCIIKYNSSIKEKYYDIIFYTKIFSKILLRVFILTIMVYILRFVIKQYNALMHNFTITAHKHSSLFGALKIIEVLPHGKVQEDFIATAGKEIFTQQKTGYLNKDETHLNINLLEKIMNILSKK